MIDSKKRLLASQGLASQLVQFFQKKGNHDEDDLKKIALKENPNVDEEVIKTIFNTWNTYSVLEDIAQHSQTPSEILSQLLSSGCGHVRIKARKALFERNEVIKK